MGLEIFEYVEPKADGRTENFEYWKSGFIHICVTDPDIEGLCKKISESGGRQWSKIWEVVPDKGIKIVFCKDPFGDIIQIYVHNYEQTIFFPAIGDHPVGSTSWMSSILWTKIKHKS